MLFAAVLAACSIAPAYAADAAKPPVKTLTPQQQKMKDCNAEAKTKALKGADRKAFMKTCLSKNGGPDAAAADAAPAAPAAPTAAAPAAAAPAAAATAAAPAAAPAAALSPKQAQQQKMKDCNAQAKTQKLKGADRKTFMSTCLKG
jgi:hypothetical protein